MIWLLPILLTAPSQSLSPRDITGVVSERKPEVKKVCFDPVASRLQQDERAKVHAKLRIDGDGRVVSSEASGGDNLPSLAPCIARLVRTWRFPFGEEPTFVVIPFVFVASPPKTPRQ
jgi:hypothetical protein